jgi:putative intracellular protease/amidase
MVVAIISWNCMRSAQMAEAKTVGVVFIEGWADWEFGLLTSSVTEWLAGRVVVISPELKPLRSLGGVLLQPERVAAPAENVDLDAVAVIGSDRWAGANPPDVGLLLTTVADRGGVVGGICAGTLALARAGLFRNAKHTSNPRDWLDHVLPTYAGRENYEQKPHAMADGRIVSAPGSAPGTFAIEMVKAVFPDKAEVAAQMRAMFAAEYA